MKYYFVSYFMTFKDGSFTVKSCGVYMKEKFLNYAVLAHQLQIAGGAVFTSILSFQEISKEHYDYVAESLEKEKKVIKVCPPSTLKQ